SWRARRRQAASRRKGVCRQGRRRLPLPLQPLTRARSALVSLRLMRWYARQHHPRIDMSTSIADERRLLAADEYEPIARSHYPGLASLQHQELLDLVRWLRDQRGKFKGQVRRR